MKIVVNEISRVLNSYFLIDLTFLVSFTVDIRKESSPFLEYSVSMPHPADHLFHIKFDCNGLKGDTIDLKMPGGWGVSKSLRGYCWHFTEKRI